MRFSSVSIKAIRSASPANLNAHLSRASQAMRAALANSESLPSIDSM
jgi:hypothetical protein